MRRPGEHTWLRLWTSFSPCRKILDFLKAQADGRAPEDDEAGVLMLARYGAIAVKQGAG